MNPARPRHCKRPALRGQIPHSHWTRHRAREGGWIVSSQETGPFPIAATLRGKGSGCPFARVDRSLFSGETFDMPFRRGSLFSALLLSAACGAPGSDAPAGSIIDDMNREILLPAPPARIVSLVPSVTDLLVALDAGDRLIARTRFDTDSTLQHLPVVGGGLDPNIEAVIGLRPDLVIVWPNPDLPVIEQLDAVGIPVYGAGSQTLEDLERHTRHLGRILGQEAAADSLLADLSRSFRLLARSLQGTEPQTALYVAWHDPPMTTGSGTFVDSILSAAGGRNVFADTPGDWPRVSMEEIVRRDPDVVLLPVGNPADTAAIQWIFRTPGWRDLRAVKTGRVLVVEADLFSRPGPRVGQAAVALARMLHPGAFSPPGP